MEDGGCRFHPGRSSVAFRAGSQLSAIIYLTDAGDSPILYIKEIGHENPRAAFRSRFPR
jgi:hypothetical protein